MNVIKSTNNGSFITDLILEIDNDDRIGKLTFEEFRGVIWDSLCFLKSNYPLENGILIKQIGLNKRSGHVGNMTYRIIELIGLGIFNV